MNKLSLCMIVRDEAEMLPRFLNAAKGLYDELCVVDTGSTDDTVALLEAAGAKVQHRAWEDDFAAARNHSLDMATSEFILVLDADEMVSPAFVTECRAMLAKENLGAATIAMSNVLPHGHKRQSHLLRLFRNRPDVRFCHRIHEDISESVISDLSQSGRVLWHLREEVEHLGYHLERCIARNKKERDSELLWRCIQEDPTDLYSWHKLLEQAHFWEDEELCEQAAQGIEQILDEYQTIPPNVLHFFGSMLVALARVRAEQDPQGTRNLVEGFSARLPEDAALRLYCGQLREEQGDLLAAKAAYEECLQLGFSTYDPQLTSTRPELGLARVALAQNRVAEAVEHIERALARHPRDPEALLALASLGRVMGGGQGSARLAKVYTESYGDVAEMHAAWGEAALLHDHPEEATGAFARACALDPASPAYASKLSLAQSRTEAP